MAKNMQTAAGKLPLKEKNKKPISSQANSLLEYLDQFFSRGENWMVWVFMGITLLFSLLLYDPKVSLSGDDSFYILRASDFIKSFKYPAFQGPLYPMTLGIVVAVFGISLTPLKLFSLAAMLAFIFLTYKAFRSRIPATLLFGLMILVSVNSYLLYYSSQTYSEAFYLFIQAVLINVFFIHFIDKANVDSIKKDVMRHLLLAACLLAVTLTKNIGFSALVAVAGYFLLKGQWRNLLIYLVIFSLVFFAFQAIRIALWSDSGLQFSTQGTGLLNKDYYNPQDGKEDFAGVIKRFTDNSNLYLSKHFMVMSGFRTYAATLPVQPFITVLLYLILLAGLLLTWRKNNYLFFSGMIGGTFLLVSFVVLQAKWDQSRLIIPAFSLILLLAASALYYMTSLKKLRVLQFILPLLIVISFFRILGASTQQIKEAGKEKGRLGGLTPDWKNYIKISEWAAANLPKDAVIACRKPSISFIYGEGWDFYGIMQLPSFDSDRFFTEWKKEPSALLAFSYSDFDGKQLSSETYKVLKRNMIAQYFAGDRIFFIDRLPDSLRQHTLEEVNRYGIREIISPDTLSRLKGKDSKSATLIYPDSLLQLLADNRVTHVLTANIRRNALVKDGKIVNTVERYMAFIEDKYPGIATKIMQIGADDNEPASILKLNYEVAGMKLE